MFTVDAGRAAVADFLRRGADLVAPAADDGAGGASEPTIGPDTLTYMSDLATESFKRQLELDESVWRSLPFFAATFAFVAAVLGRAATDTPVLSWSMFSIVAHILFVLAVSSLAWALRWFVPILRKREYEYPSDDAAVKRYASDMTAYHAALGLEGDDLDAKVLEELRLFMIDQHGSAARTNFGLNGMRMAARSKVLLFMLIGFVLAFLCEATIFIHKDLAGPAEVHDDAEKRQGGYREPSDGAVHPGSADAAQVPAGDGRREFLGNEVQAAAGPGEAGVRKPSPQPPTGTAQAPARPTPPSPQFMAKRATELGYSYDHRLDQPTETERPKPAGDKKRDR